MTMGLPIGEVLDVLRPVLESEKNAKIGQNIKYDALLLRHHGVVVRNILFDRMIAAYIYRFDGSHSMDALAQEYLKYRPVPLEEVVGQLKSVNVRRLMAIAPGLLAASPLRNWPADVPPPQKWPGRNANATITRLTNRLRTTLPLH